jgi:type IV pilus assembly protein PilC
MPVFDQVFRQLGTEMNGISRALLVAGTFLSDHALGFVIVIILILLAAVFLVKRHGSQKFFEQITARFNATRKLSEQIAAYRFANGMALTLSSGLPPEECLNLTSQLVPDGSFHDKISECKLKMANGEDLYASLLTSGIFPGVYTKMAAIAARTGMMDEIMHTIAEHYEEEIDARITRLLAAVEPTLVIILSVIVGIILLSVMLPLINIMSSL